MKMDQFTLVYEHQGRLEEFGTMWFNGRFVFELKQGIPYDYWKQIGIIPVDPETRRYESSDLHFYLNARLPIYLRGASKEEKVNYILKSGLKVPSDNFYFQPSGSFSQRRNDLTVA